MNGIRLLLTVTVGDSDLQGCEVLVLFTFSVETPVAPVLTLTVD